MVIITIKRGNSKECISRKIKMIPEERSEKKAGKEE